MLIFRKINASKAFLECLNEHLHQTLAKLALTISIVSVGFGIDSVD